MNNFHKSREIKEINRFLWKLATFRIKLLGFISPKVLHFAEDKLVVRVKLNRRTKNNLNSMYLGALVMGAELAAALPYAFLATKENLKFSLVIAGMESKYLKRPDSDVFFEVKDLTIFEKLLSDTRVSGIRSNKRVQVKAFTFYEDSSKTEKVATFTFELSVKVKI